MLPALEFPVSQVGNGRLIEPSPSGLVQSFGELRIEAGMAALIKRQQPFRHQVVGTAASCR